MTIGEIATTALLYTLLGMGTVFAVLILISLVIYFLGLALRKDNEKEQAARAAAKKAEEEAKAAKAAKAAAAAGAASGNDDELMAVIAIAAIRAYIRDHEEAEAASDADFSGYVVRNIRRATWKHIS